MYFQSSVSLPNAVWISLIGRPLTVGYLCVIGLATPFTLLNRVAKSVLALKRRPIIGGAVFPLIILGLQNVAKFLYKFLFSYTMT